MSTRIPNRLSLRVYLLDPIPAETVIYEADGRDRISQPLQAGDDGPPNYDRYSHDSDILDDTTECKDERGSFANL
jgi:hypothetical protein